MQTIGIKMEMTSTAFVFIELPSDKSVDDITPEMIVEACDHQLDVPDSRDWIPEKLAPLQIGIVPQAADLEISVYRPFLRQPTMAERADHIGVSRNTLHRWRSEGVDIHDDAAVRLKISRSRNWIPGLSDKFKQRLSGS